MESPPISPMLARYAGYGPRGRARKCVMVLQAYIDDSTQYVNRKRKLFILAGCINYVENWVDFDKAWDDELAKFPAIAYCHMADAEVFRGEFNGWTAPQRDRKVLALSKTISQSNGWSFDISIDFDEYSEYFDISMPYPWQTPTFFAFLQTMRLIIHLHKIHGITMPVDLFFDETDAMVRPFNAFYQASKESMPKEFGNLLGQQPQFLSDKNISALQAADMLAWHVQKETVGRKLIPSRAASVNLFRPKRHISLAVDKSMLLSGANMVGTGRYESEYTTKSFWKKVLSAIERGDVDLMPPIDE